MPVSTRKRIRKSKGERRREIAEAAVKLMGKHGLAGITVSHIAKALGISNSALYQHYHNREAVLWAAAELVSDRSDEWIFITSGANGFERVAKLAEGHLAWSTSKLDTFVRPVFAMTVGAKQAGITHLAGSAAQHAVHLISQIVEEGQRDGSIRADADPRDLAWGVIMCAWAEDMALLNDAREVTIGGVSRRNFSRFLATFAPPERQPDEEDQAHTLTEMSESRQTTGS